LCKILFERFRDIVTLPRVIPVASHAVAVTTITVLLVILAHGVTADPLASLYARALARSAGGYPGTEVARHTGM
jgi:hypothetical protein